MAKRDQFYWIEALCNRPVHQIEPHPTSWQYPLINYLDQKHYVPEHDGLESIHNLRIIGAQVVFSVGQSQSTLQQITLEVSKDFIRLICVYLGKFLCCFISWELDLTYVNGF